MRSLRRLQREQEPRSPFVFTSERGSPFTTAGFACMLERASEAAGLALKVHPHMLRHACGFALANKGHDTRALQGLPWATEYPAHGALYRAVAATSSRISGDRTRRSAAPPPAVARALERGLSKECDGTPRLPDNRGASLRITATPSAARVAAATEVRGKLPPRATLVPPACPSR